MSVKEQACLGSIEVKEEWSELFGYALKSGALTNSVPSTDSLF